MTDFSIDPNRLAAYDRAYNSACSAVSVMNATVRELCQKRNNLVLDIERKTQGAVRGRHADFFVKAIQSGFASEADVAAIQALDAEISRARNHERASEEHRSRLNDAVYRVRILAGRSG